MKQHTAVRCTESMTCVVIMGPGMGAKHVQNMAARAAAAAATTADMALIACVVLWLCHSLLMLYSASCLPKICLCSTHNTR